MPESKETRWLRVIHDLVEVTQPPARLLALGENGAALAMADGSLATVMRVEGTVPEAVAEKLQRIVQDNPRANLKHVLVGGDASGQAVLARTQPKLGLRRSVQVFQLGGDGELWVGSGTRRDSPMSRALLRAAEPAKGDEEITRQLVTGLVRPPTPPSPEEKAAIAKGQAFVDRYRAARPRVVFGLLALVAVMFGLENLWGNSELAPTLMRMGANTEESLGAEPWRLVSSMFLHAGWLHVAVNAYVLVALGGFLERVLGPWRFLILFFVGGLAGSLASALTGAAIMSVGASGAIWAGLGAATVLALVPSGVIPPTVMPSIRRTAIVNLVINLSVSFLPEVDLWAHLGGGVAGALLVWTGALTRGLAPGEPAAHAAPDPSWLRPSALLAAAVMVASPATAVVAGQAWVLGQAPDLQPRPLGETGLQVEVPRYFAPLEAYPDDDTITFVVGQPLYDPYAMLIMVQPHRLDEASRDELLATMRGGTPPVPEGAEPDKAWGDSDIGARSLEATYVYPNGARIKRWYTVNEATTVLVELSWWPDGPAAYRPAMTRSLESLAD